MKRIFILLLLLSGISGQPVWAEAPPADSKDTPAAPADTTQKPDGDSKAPREGNEEEEPDCE